jgi:hypothetical protein
MLQLGLHPEELLDTEEAVIWRELRYLKLKREDIISLIQTFGIDRIRQQLHWLPARDTKEKDKGRVLVTALMNNHGPQRTLTDVLKDPSLRNKYATQPQADPNSTHEDES